MRNKLGFLPWESLAVLLQRSGIEWNVPRAVELYARAIDDGESILAMYGLATILETDDGVPADPERAAVLRRRIAIATDNSTIASDGDGCLHQ